MTEETRGILLPPYVGRGEFCDGEDKEKKMNPYHETHKK
jgi:hypothetical protein